MIGKRIFVSSVMQGYEDRRQAAREAVLEVGMEPFMAEDLRATPGAPRDVILADGLQSCELLVGIYGNRYGWSGAQAGFSPTEEEYDEARRLWKPIYAFIDRIEGGPPEARQRQFLEKVQNWDIGLVRDEFRSLAELKQKIKETLAGEHLSPRHRAFLGRVRLQATRVGYREIAETRLPAFDALLHKPASGVHLTMDPHKLIAVVDGDHHDSRQISSIVALWRAALIEYFQPSVWKQTSFEAFVVVAVEDNPFGLGVPVLPAERSAKFGGYYGVLADLVSCKIVHPPLRMKDRGVKVWLLEPILEPALSGLCR